MIKVNVILNNINWKRYLKNPNRFIDKKIALLNKKNKLFKKNTLICSLLLSGAKEINIMINLSQVKKKNNKAKFKEELNKLWIHGLLHLLGYDHKSNSQYLQMQKLEKKFSYLIK